MILEHRGLFEEKRDCKINNSGVYGMTEKADLADREGISICITPRSRST